MITLTHRRQIEQKCNNNGSTENSKREQPSPFHAGVPLFLPAKQLICDRAVAYHKSFVIESIRLIVNPMTAHDQFVSVG